ncbi:MAG TPA: hypothetical protein PKI90_11885 [bacterium]|nr:hypothetical protein [bacterium]
MAAYLYLSIFPESLIASMLPPEEFGIYFSTGTAKRSRGQALFLEIDRDFTSDYFNLDDVAQRCQPHIDGQPKRSVYLSIYRVLEHLPVSALKNLYLVSDEGKVLELPKMYYLPEEQRQLHLYQELCPVMPRIATLFNPLEFCRFVTNREFEVSVPRLFFMEMELGGLAIDPLLAPADELPYAHIEHLRDCLIGLAQQPEKPTKTVSRYLRSDISFATIKNGFFIGDQQEICHYPFPAHEELLRDHYDWWQSVRSTEDLEL